MPRATRLFIFEIFQNRNTREFKSHCSDISMFKQSLVIVMTENEIFDSLKQQSSNLQNLPTIVMSYVEITLLSDEIFFFFLVLVLEANILLIFKISKQIILVRYRRSFILL